MMQGKAKWRVAMITLMAILWIAAAVLGFLNLYWTAYAGMAQRWIYLLLLAGAAAQRTAVFPFGIDYLRAADVGHADWKYRFVWLVSCMLILGLGVAIAIAPSDFQISSFGFIGFFLLVALSVPGEEKFAPRRQVSPSPSDTSREAIA